MLRARLYRHRHPPGTEAIGRKAAVTGDPAPRVKMTPTGHLRRGRVAGVKATTFLSCGLCDHLVGAAEQLSWNVIPSALAVACRRSASHGLSRLASGRCRNTLRTMHFFCENATALGNALAWPELKRSCLCPPNRSSSQGATRYFRSSKPLKSSGCVVSAGYARFAPARLWREPVRLPTGSRSFWQERSRLAGPTNWRITNLWLSTVRGSSWDNWPNLRVGRR